MIIDLTWDLSEKILFAASLSGEVAIIDLNSLDFRLADREAFLAHLRTQYLSDADRIIALHAHKFQNEQLLLQ